LVVLLAGQFRLGTCSDFNKPITANNQFGQNLDYNPKLVDWRSMIKAFEFLARQEPRLCNFMVRAHFHDAGAFKPTSGPSKAFGADGSLMLDQFEFLQPENAYDAFSVFVRSALVELSQFYRASFADMLNVGAATCVRALGSGLDIIDSCSSQGVPIYVRPSLCSCRHSK
jgi:hypothetical protein